MDKKAWLRLTVMVLVTALVLTGVSVWQCATELTVKAYTLEAEVAEPIRLVQLTDLHGWDWGSTLVELVAAQEPDLILMTGDMLDRTDEGPEAVCALIGELSQIAPVYYCYGNHEYEWMARHGGSLTPALTEAGAVVLDVGYVDVTVKGTELRIGGYHGYYRQPHMFAVTEEEKAAQFAFFGDFEDTDRFKLLLNHIPTAWLDWGYIDKFPVDLVLSGHYHGGQVRLPLIGGLYAPYVGFFPEYTQGLFEGTAAKCVLSTGLGSSPGIPRIGNPPQIVTVTLTPGG